MKLKKLIDIFFVSLKLGFTSFGGPIAHLGYFHEEYIKRRRWLDEKTYADLVALCQFLPGPASSQVGIGIGTIRGGMLGGLISFIGFTLPSMLALIIFALFIDRFAFNESGFIHGLKLVAVAIVAHAIVGMSKTLTPDAPRKSIALFVMIGILIWPSTITQIVFIILAGITGFLLYRNQDNTAETELKCPVSYKAGAICLSIFVILLITLPIVRAFFDIRWLAMFDSFYRAGSLVFGGGHVVLPLLEGEFVAEGLLTEDAFLTGYGAAQAVPGPLFTFASYIGTVIGGWSSGLLATVAIFLPAYLLVIGTLPFWNSIRRNPSITGALMGVNAGVVGLLIAAFYHPIWTSAIVKPQDFALSALLFSMLAFWKIPVWLVVVAGAICGWLISFY
ncbi:chromate transporter [Bacillus sp. CECT 9360]|uniref:chromate transporter n=1 Tax=Bacillus sp. CECT 9360 TaxID=2845821 RepID=UPI001E2D0728|nr:chromate transporter [Bacillus sp. CECT 9360]CAH0344024.1 Chromate transport protein [Bacillus sp. CECT 9360]